jgi:DNA-binding FrmR family transcriptional regulator
MAVVPWLVLIYTLPAEPTRKRAFVWRELKKVGAVYLRDGVCVLPDRPAAREAMHAIVERIRAFEGQATLVERSVVDELTARSVVVRVQAAREAEYAALADASRELLSHLRRESRHRDFSAQQTRTLLEDVNKLHNWFDQIRARDFFTADNMDQAQATLAECDSSLRNLSAGVAVR